MKGKYIYRRCAYKSSEWEELVRDGWETLHVNDNDIALLIKERE